MIDIDIEVDVREVRAGLARLLAAGADLSPAMREIAGHLADSAAQSFEAEAGPGIGPWAPLDPDTIDERRAKRYGDGPILQRSGDLARSILADWDDTTAVAGTNLVYAATHQFGDEERGIPARPFLGLWPEHRGDIARAVAAHLAAAVR